MLPHNTIQQVYVTVGLHNFLPFRWIRTQFPPTPPPAMATDQIAENDWCGNNPIHLEEKLLGLGTP